MKGIILFSIIDEESISYSRAIDDFRVLSL